MRLIVAALSVALSGCSLLLAEGEQDAGQIDAPLGDCEEACGGATPFCRGEVCVACDALPSGEDADAQCQSLDRNEPICDRGECRQCRSHADCDTDVCDVISGECITPTGVTLFVDTSAAKPTTGACPGLRCRSLEEAVDHIRSDGGMDWTIVIVSLVPYNNQAVTFSAVSVRILGFGASLTGTSHILVQSGATVSIDGLSMNSITTGGNPSAISCTAATLELREVAIKGVDAQGILGNSCAFLTVQRSRIEETNGSGIALGGSEFNISHSLIAKTTGPAVLVSDATDQSRFRFNTVTATDGVPNTPSVVCTNSAADFSASIVWEEDSVPGASDECGFTSSIVRNGNPDNVSTDDPLLTESFRPGAGSPALNQADVAERLEPNALDVALEPRDSMAPTYGAFELPDG